MDLNKSPKISRKLLSDDVEEYLIDAMLQGDLQPGEKITELRLAKHLDVSQSTIREALRILEAKKYIKSIPFKGTFVREFNTDGLSDYFKTRTEIEMIAVRWAADQDHANVDWNVLNECVELMGSSSREDDLISFRKADIKFHRAIVESANNPMLISSWDALNHRFWAYLGIYMGNRFFRINTQEGMHRRILQLFREMRFEDLQKEMKRHYIDIDAMQKLVTDVWPGNKKNHQRLEDRGKTREMKSNI